MVSDQTSTVKSRAIRELTIAAVGTGITLVFAIILYSLVPSLRIYMQEKRDTKDYTRLIQYENGFMQVRYQAKNTEMTAERLKQKADVLARRFERAQFGMLTVSEPTIESSRKAMEKNITGLQVKRSDSGEVFSVIMQARSPGARQALKDYASILQENWQIR